jgi:hypothetical protein
MAKHARMTFHERQFGFAALPRFSELIDLSHRVLLVFVLVAALIVSAGCQPKQSIAHESEATNSLEAAWTRLRDSYAMRSYGSMRQHIVPEIQDRLIDLLIAVDELAAAESAVRRVVGDEALSPYEEYLGHAQVAQLTACFADRVEVLDSSQDRDRGVVRIAQAGQSSGLRCDFVRRRGRWLYVTEAPSREMISSIRELAFSLDRVAFVSIRKQLDADQLESEFRSRVIPHHARVIECMSLAIAAQTQ